MWMPNILAEMVVKSGGVVLALLKPNTGIFHFYDSHALPTYFSIVINMHTFVLFPGTGI